MEIKGEYVSLEHLIDVVKRRLTRLTWKYVKLTPRTKMSVKRAATLFSFDVALYIIKGSFKPEETVATRTYFLKCHKLFQVFNSNTGVNSTVHRELIKIMLWFEKWYKEVEQSIPPKTSKRDHWRKFIFIITYEDLKRSIRAFLGLVQYVQMQHPEVQSKTMGQDVENYFSLQRARVQEANQQLCNYLSLQQHCQKNF